MRSLDVAHARTAAAAPGPVLEVRALSMHFRAPGGGTVNVLARIDLEVRKGEFVCVVGPSGCGKSTLLNIIAGFVPPSGGEVIVEGEAVRGPDPRRMFVFQENGLFPWMTVRGNIALGLRRQPPEEQARIVAHYVRLMGLDGFEDAYPPERAGG